MPVVLLYGIAAFTLWHAPLYGWLLLISGWARRMPILWALLPQIVLSIVERIVFNTNYVGRFIQHRMMGAMTAAFDFAAPPVRGKFPILDRVTQLDPGEIPENAGPLARPALRRRVHRRVDPSAPLSRTDLRLEKGTNMANHRARRIWIRIALAVLVGAAVAAGSLFAEGNLIEQGRAAMGRGDYDAAIENLEKAVAQSPKSAEAHYHLGSAYGAKVQSGGMLAAARYAGNIKEEFEKAVALDPKYVDAHYALVQVYASAPEMMGGSYEKAFEHAKAIKAIDPIVGHRAYAFTYTQQKNLDAAKKEYADADSGGARLGKGPQLLRAVPLQHRKKLSLRVRGARGGTEGGSELHAGALPPRPRCVARRHEPPARRRGAQEIRRLHAEGQ